MNKTLAAWTEESGKSYPEYLNFSLDGDDVVVTLRETPYIAENGTPCNGNTASVRLPAGKFWVMMKNAEQGLFA